jgi:hypothetical protein
MRSNPAAINRIDTLSHSIRSLAAGAALRWQLRREHVWVAAREAGTRSLRLRLQLLSRVRHLQQESGSPAVPAGSTPCLHQGRRCHRRPRTARWRGSRRAARRQRSTDGRVEGCEACIHSLRAGKTAGRQQTTRGRSCGCFLAWQRKRP